jgi:hypothetical protein
MSLVHEALQKAEREKQRKVGAALSASVAAPTAQPVQTPTVPSPAAIVAAGTTPREKVVHKPAPAVEEPQRTNPFLLPVLIGCVAIVAIIAIVFLVSNATSALRQSREVSSAPATTASASAARSTEARPPPRAVQTSIEPSIPPSVQPSASAAGNDSQYKLSGIMKDPDGKYVAVLNGRVAYEGYYIDGATVKKIEHDRVTVEVVGRETVLRLF